MRLAVASDRGRQGEEDSATFGTDDCGGKRRVPPTGDALGVGLVPLLMEV